MSIEKRADPRYLLTRNCNLVLPNGKTIVVKSHDISISGMSLLYESMLPPGMIGQLTFSLTLRTGFRTITTSVLVVHNVLAKDSLFRVGLKFHKLDIKSAAILAEFISYRAEQG